MAVDFLKEHLKAVERKAAEKAAAVEEDWIIEFDVTLGHIITVITFIATICFAYMVLDKKVDALEENITTPSQRNPK